MGKIAAANNMKSPYRLLVGQIIRIPKSCVELDGKAASFKKYNSAQTPKEPKGNQGLLGRKLRELKQQLSVDAITQDEYEALRKRALDKFADQ
jgi:hypothetical protein